MRFANWKLKKKIANSGFRVYEIEREANLPSTKLSRIANGHTKPNQEEKKSIAKALKTPVGEIFAEDSRNE